MYNKEEVLTPMCDVQEEAAETGCGCDCNVMYGVCDCNTCNAEMGCNDKCEADAPPYFKCADVFNGRKSNPSNANKFEQCLALSNHYLTLYNTIKQDADPMHTYAQGCIEESLAWADVAGETLVESGMANW